MTADQTPDQTPDKKPDKKPDASGEPVLAWIERRTAATRQRDVEFDDPRLEYRRLFSEVWGTFLLVLVAAGGGVIGATAFGGDLTLAMKALAPGMMVMGDHLLHGHHLRRPPQPRGHAGVRGARQLPVASRPGLHRRRARRRAAGGLVPPADVRRHHQRRHRADPSVSTWVAMLTEAVLTLGLVSVILGTASGARNVGINGALAIGGYIGLVSVWGAPVTGASMNPARSLAPDADRRRTCPTTGSTSSARSSAR